MFLKAETHTRTSAQHHSRLRTCTHHTFFMYKVIIKVIESNVTFEYQTDDCVRSWRMVSSTHIICVVDIWWIDGKTHSRDLNVGKKSSSHRLKSEHFFFAIRRIMRLVNSRRCLARFVDVIRDAMKYGSVKLQFKLRMVLFSARHFLYFTVDNILRSISALVALFIVDDAVDVIVRKSSSAHTQ